MSKIGLVIVNRSTNYGALLQSFATQHFIDSLGHDTEVIVCGSSRGLSAGIKKVLRHMVPVVFRNTMKSIRRKRNLNRNKVVKMADSKRIMQGDDFANKYMHDFKKFRDINELSEYSGDNYTTVLIGSDQQWTPQCFYNDINTLRFVPDSINKVSYATSMGVSSIPWYTRHTLNKFISRINHISVREKTGKKIIEEITGRTDVAVTPDPTLLLDKADWDAAIPNTCSDKDYIFCYFLSNNGESMRRTLEYAKEKNIRVIAVRNIEVFDEDKTDYGFAEVLEAPSFEDFVNYIRNAKCVFTDSFHGTMFSIINQKNFVTFYRTKHTDKDSRNSRVDDFLNMIELDCRIANETRDPADIADKDIDYSLVNEKVKELRNTGRSFLQETLV